MGDSVYKIALAFTIGMILLAVLPISPFNGMVNEMTGVPYLSYLNWFFPVGKCLGLMAVWTFAISVYYGWSYILRQLGFTD